MTEKSMVGLTHASVLTARTVQAATLYRAVSLQMSDQSGGAGGGHRSTG